MKITVLRGKTELAIVTLLLGGLAAPHAEAMSDAEAYADCQYWAGIMGPGPCTLMPLPASFPYAGQPSYAYYNRTWPWPVGWIYAGPITDQANAGVDRSKGGGASSQCGVENVFVTDPINPLNGNEYFTETDYQGSRGLLFKRFYNSLLGGWTYSYSRNLFVANVGQVDLIADNGEKLSFYLNSGVWTGVPGTGGLTANGAGWIYADSNNELSYFDGSGKLIKVSTPYNEITIVNLDGAVKLTSSLGDTGTLLTAAYGRSPLSSATFPGVSLTYQNDSRSNFTSVTKVSGGSSQGKTYLYEKTTNLSLLTGVMDERGVRYLTLAYDSQDRAISSDTAGVGKVTVLYGNDGSSTVTNEYGKAAVYQTVVFNGVRRVSSIVGAPSPNCPASNSSYTYNSLGQILTKTDALGYITSYIYNDRGLEISRTEASGTPLARTITTEWDPSLSLPAKVIELTRTTLYTYDSKGRQLSQRVTAN